MNDNLKAKIVAKLSGLDDEPGRQLLDYLEFLESKYNRSRRAAGALQRITENLEDSLGSVRIGEVAGRGVDAAGRLMTGLMAAGRAVADELTGAPVPASRPGNGAQESVGDDAPSESSTTSEGPASTSEPPPA